jgi:hypothetical protein
MAACAFNNTGFSCIGHFLAHKLHWVHFSGAMSSGRRFLPTQLAMVPMGQR